MMENISMYDGSNYEDYTDKQMLKEMKTIFKDIEKELMKHWQIHNSRNYCNNWEQTKNDEYNIQERITLKEIRIQMILHILSRRHIPRRWYHCLINDKIRLEKTYRQEWCEYFIIFPSFTNDVKNTRFYHCFNNMIIELCDELSENSNTSIDGFDFKYNDYDFSIYYQKTQIPNKTRKKGK